MRKKTEKAVRRYLRQVNKYLPCAAGMRHKLILQLHKGLNAFIHDEPDTNYEKIVAQFGRPEDVAASYVESAGTSEILRSLLIRKKIITVIIAVSAVIIISWAAVVTWAIIRENDTLNGVITKEVVEIESTP
ncbi:MAG: hypothetical protein IKE57_01675 [Oscillospiraceae bacterium]|nr:hypothetical protein [Oscillospiraceae bacterium]